MPTLALSPAVARLVRLGTTLAAVVSAACSSSSSQFETDGRPPPPPASSTAPSPEDAGTDTGAVTDDEDCAVSDGADSVEVRAECEVGAFCVGSLYFGDERPSDFRCRSCVPNNAPSLFCLDAAACCDASAQCDAGLCAVPGGTTSSMPEPTSGSTAATVTGEPTTGSSDSSSSSESSSSTGN